MDDAFKIKILVGQQIKYECKTYHVGFLGTFWLCFGFERGLARYSLISLGLWGRVGACYVICKSETSVLTRSCLSYSPHFSMSYSSRDSTGVTKTFKHNLYVFQHVFTNFYLYNFCNFKSRNQSWQEPNVSKPQYFHEFFPKWKLTYIMMFLLKLTSN